MDDGGIEKGWRPSPPPKHGSPKWKDNVAFEYCSDNHLLDKTKELGGSSIFKMPIVDGIDLGYMAIRYYTGSGWDYFRVDSIIGE